jgi:hypothetical protein
MTNVLEEVINILWEGGISEGPPEDVKKALE